MEQDVDNQKGESRMFKITIYETEYGKIPMREFLVGLDKQAFEAVGIAVEKLKREGNLLR